MLEYVWRFTINQGQQNEFIEWLRANGEDLKNHTRPGSTYLGTWITVNGLGAYSGEARWALDGYASLGEGWGDQISQRLLSEWLAMTDNIHRYVTLLRSVETVQSLPDV
jgi:hypothetical protein